MVFILEATNEQVGNLLVCNDEGKCLKLAFVSDSSQGNIFEHSTFREFINSSIQTSISSATRTATQVAKSAE